MRKNTLIIIIVIMVVSIILIACVKVWRNKELVERESHFLFENDDYCTYEQLLPDLKTYREINCKNFSNIILKGNTTIYTIKGSGFKIFYRSQFTSIIHQLDERNLYIDANSLKGTSEAVFIFTPVCPDTLFTTENNNISDQRIYLLGFSGESKLFVKNSSLSIETDIGKLSGDVLKDGSLDIFAKGNKNKKHDIDFNIEDSRFRFDSHNSTAIDLKFKIKKGSIQVAIDSCTYMRNLDIRGCLDDSVFFGSSILIKSTQEPVFICDSLTLLIEKKGCNNFQLSLPYQTEIKHKNVQISH